MQSQTKEKVTASAGWISQIQNKVIAKDCSEWRKCSAASSSKRKAEMRVKKIFHYTQ